MKSKIRNRRPDKLSKTELLRRRRLGHLRRLLRDRCGSVLPDDDAGRDYLKELLLPISLGPSETVHWGPTDRMRCAIEVWTPWMSEDEALELRLEVNAMPRWERWPNPKTLGQRLNVTYAERERLRLWAIDPCDMTKAAMKLMRKRKKRQRDKLRRQKQPRAEYLAASLSQTKPWKQEGISRASWYRQQRETSVHQIKLIKSECTPVSREGLSSKAGSCVRPSTATPAWLMQTCVRDFPQRLTAGSSRWEAA
jgi:hypothetical protein